MITIIRARLWDACPLLRRNPTDNVARELIQFMQKPIIAQYLSAIWCSKSMMLLINLMRQVMYTRYYCAYIAAYLY